MNTLRKRTWAEIDLDAIRGNYSIIKSATASKLCCVIKANGYGHGAVELAKLYEELGADFFAVSNIEEALQLRSNQIIKPILILGYTPVECAALLSTNNISQCVYSLEYAEKLNAQEVDVKVHIKLDTGMGRIGFRQDELDDALKACQLQNLITEGVFMHFAVADESTGGEDYTRKQFEKFQIVYQYLESHGVHFDIHHCANSAAIFDYPEFHLDMVRAGVVLYGLKPSDKVVNLPELKPALTLKSVISHIKEIEPGYSLSYGRAFVADKAMRVATVPIGYADGFWRTNGNQKYAVMIGDKYAIILGRVCMDQMMVDVSEIECHCGDQIIIFGAEEKCCADEIARVNGTINYEVVCAIGERIPRAYYKDSQIVSWKDNLVE